MREIYDEDNDDTSDVYFENNMFSHEIYHNWLDCSMPIILTR